MFGGLKQYILVTQAPASVPRDASRVWMLYYRFDYYAQGISREGKLALTLFVAWIFADHHDHTITADHLALIADRLHARVNLHGLLLLRLRVQWSVTTFVARIPEGNLNNEKSLLVAVDDTAAVEVVRAEFHHYAILREDSNVVLTHLSRDSCKHNVSIGQLNTEHRIGQRL
jgi:hypothetical protein